MRGRGLWVGVELDASVSAREVVERLAERGVLTKDTHGTVIRFAPPLTISRDALDWGIDVFADTLHQFEAAAAYGEYVEPAVGIFFENLVDGRSAAGIHHAFVIRQHHAEFRVIASRLADHLRLIEHLRAEIEQVAANGIARRKRSDYTIELIQ